MAVGLGISFWMSPVGKYPSPLVSPSIWGAVPHFIVIFTQLTPDHPLPVSMLNLEKLNT